MILVPALLIWGLTVLLNGGSPIDWVMTLDALEAFRWMIPILMTSGATLLLVGIVRLASSFEFKQLVDLHLPEIARERVRDAETRADHFETEAKYWQGRANEVNALIAGIDRRLQAVTALLGALPTEDEIRKLRTS